MAIMQSSDHTARLRSGESGAKPYYLVYGIGCYVVGVTGLVSLILGMGNIIPIGYVAPITNSSLTAVLTNFCLIAVFALQHTTMARPGFKLRFNKKFAPAVERSTFVLGAGLAAIFLVVLWQPVGDVVIWQASSPGAKFLAWTLFLFGWFYLLAATFAINHFDLFGLRQTYLAARGREYTPLTFKENWMYRFSRHPIMLGALIGIWFAPVMTATHLSMALLFTIYIAIGIRFEERDLIVEFGDDYRDYKRRVGALFTLSTHGRR